MENVWINIDNDWKEVKYIKKIDNTTHEVSYNNNIYTIDSFEICNDIDEIKQKDNLVDIPHLNEPSILNAVHTRYIDDIIYTYTGRILIAVNPFKNLNLFTNNIISKYRGQSDIFSPHIYQIADEAFKNLSNQTKNQTILVSGESGAGKTYSVRNIIKYLTKCSNNPSNIEAKIVESNPILEAFGNAKTLRNDNSSRFGKFIKVQIQNDSIVGCNIDTYLLEKIRVIQQHSKERNFHIFYQLLSSSWRDKYFLSNFDHYSFLNNKYIQCKDINDMEEFNLTLKAFHIMGFKDETIEDIFKIIASILHLGNIQFDEEGWVINSDLTIYISTLLNLKEKDLIKCLTYRKLKTIGEIYDIKMSKEDCIKTRNSMSMKLYSNMFDYIVKIINKELNSNCNSFIGILDIFGFESFETNSFEQFCINYTNETLQDQFNEYMFKLEQKEYEAEEIDWQHIAFPDNKKCLSLIESKGGIIKMLDEECKLPRGSDKGFTNKLWKKYSENNYIKENKKYIDTRFIINHYAGEVEYTSIEFCDKNRDIISDTIQTLINTIPIINDKSEITSRINMKTIVIQFKTQLHQLMSIISDTSSHYIRCIKPNDLNIENNFNRIRVNQQIKYSGILAAIKVSRAGYPVRFLKEGFVNRYNIIRDFKHYEQLLSQIEQQYYIIGKTKIFLKNKAYDILEDLRTNTIAEKIIQIQSVIRRFLERKRYLNIYRNIITIQCKYRQFIAYKELHKRQQQKAAIIIQKYYRKYFFAIRYNDLKKKINKIKTWYTSIIYNYNFIMYFHEIVSIIKIQRSYKKYIIKKSNKKIIDQKQQWDEMVNKWNKVENKTFIHNILFEIVDNIERNQIEKKKKQIEKEFLKIKLERKISVTERNTIQEERNTIQEERNTIHAEQMKIQEEREKLLQEKISIEQQKEELNNDNIHIKTAITHSVNMKIKMARKMEKLMEENLLMRRKMNTMSNRSQTQCIIN